MEPELPTAAYLREIGIADWGVARVPVLDMAPAGSQSASSTAAAAGVAQAPAKAATKATKPAAPAAPAGAAPAKSSKEPAKEGSKKAPKEAKAASQASAAEAPAAGPPPAEKSKEELAKMSKDERTAYYAARKAAGALGAPKAKAAPATKAERRAVQEMQRNAKEGLKNLNAESEEMFQELKLQGLTEEQAREVMAQMAVEVGGSDAEDDEDDGPEDLLSSVKRWMAEHETEKPDKESVKDFNMKVRFQGHVDSTPPDHLHCILQLLVAEACASCDLSAPKLQPAAVSKKVTPVIAKWSIMLGHLYSKIDDPLVAGDVIVKSVRDGVFSIEAPDNGKDYGVVGCLMAVREEVEAIEDEDLLTGCKRLEPVSRVMEKFIDFLEDQLADSDEDSSGSED